MIDYTYVLEAERLTTSYLENQGNGPDGYPTFTIRDLLMVGNSYAPDAHVSRYDAFIGQALRGDGAGKFRPLSLEESGFYVDTDVKDIIQLNRNGKSAWVVASNNDSLRVFTKTPTETHRPKVANK